MVCVLVFVTGVEVWKAIKRRTGWFAEQETEGMKKTRAGPMSLRQGFFSFARTLTGASFSRSKTEETGEMGELSMDGDRGPGHEGHLSGREIQRLPEVKEEV